MSLNPTQRDWARATRDLVNGIMARHVWMLLGVNDVKVRYNRSRFGQFWITLSMGIFIGGIGLVYSTLFNQPVQGYLPYLAVNITIWTFISGIISDAPNVFTQAGLYLRQDALPRTVFVMRLLTRHLIILGHNLVIVPLAFLVFLYPVDPILLLAIPGVVIVGVGLFFLTLLLGVLSTRFRDLPQIIVNALQLLFFVTPVMWRADQMDQHRQLLVILNPFAAWLRIIAEPILGRAPLRSAYEVSIAFIVVLILITLPLFARFRARLVYWL